VTLVGIHHRIIDQQRLICQYLFSCIAIAGYDLSQEKLKAAGTPVAR
jgi:hypothetical protein